MGPGEYRADPTEGITSVEDLPQAKRVRRSRNYSRRPCPECGRRGAGELVESQVINSKVHTEWRNARSIFRRNSTGRELVRVTESTYEDHFECQYCGHQWTKTAQERKRQSSRENEAGRQR